MGHCNWLLLPPFLCSWNVVSVTQHKETHTNDNNDNDIIWKSFSFVSKTVLRTQSIIYFCIIATWRSKMQPRIKLIACGWLQREIVVSLSDYSGPMGRLWSVTREGERETFRCTSLFFTNMREKKEIPISTRNYFLSFKRHSCLVCPLIPAVQVRGSVLPDPEGHL